MCTLWSLLHRLETTIISMDPDQVIAGLVGMGFSLSDIANALEVVGPSMIVWLIIAAVLP